MHIEKMGSNELRSFLASGRKATLKFWRDNLNEICPKGGSLSQDIDTLQINYGARFLTRFSLVSTGSDVYFPTFTSLVEIYDNFLHNTMSRGIPSLMELAGCQTLLLSGFYKEYAIKHYDLQDLCRIGRDFFNKSAVGKRKKVIKKVSANFDIWQELLHNLRVYLQEKRLLLESPNRPEPLIKIAPP
ncbi:MAG: hypothetical protein WD898_00420 [Candidatus Paceibacterota bacterium]